MTGSEAYRAKLISDDALDAAISAYLADPSRPVVLEMGKDAIDIVAAVPAKAYSMEVLAREAARPGSGGMR